MKEPSRDTLISAQDNRRMFDRIAPRYDLLNAVMSFGLHRSWRRQAIRSLMSRQGTRFLDIGCGTGDMMIAIARQYPGAKVTGIDPARHMLALATDKIHAAGLADRIRCQEGDATALEFGKAEFDGISCAFCLRNIEDRTTALAEMRRILRPGGTLAILELTVPSPPLFRAVHRLYTRRIIPLLGHLFSQADAYAYLADSIDHFPASPVIVNELTQAGFDEIEARPLTGGFVTLFTGQAKTRDTGTAPLRFAAPAYANSVPLAQFIPVVCPHAELVLDYPARLLERLLERRVDAALMPVADFFTTPGLAMIPGLGIGTEQHVRSVLLRCNRPLQQVETVKLDPASRTSNALARILLERHWKRPVRFIEGGSKDSTDAEVVIGDRALCEPAGPGGDYDLASAWHDMTGLPFVFAVWVFHRDHPQSERLAEVVRQAKEAGLAALPELVRQQAAKLKLEEPFCLDYFTRCIRYDLTPQHLEAMRLFREMIAGDQQ
ncbi:MAG: bifunctional demethylmenaquinone methyltransferase/2-methoxy-6-polyprenyl-1,4-benzoquinol methylase UbiE [bacterium]